MEKVVMIIPTYNERGNIEPLVDILQKVFKKVPSQWEMHILFVDDSSPDGTADIVRKKMEEFDNVHLFLNKEKVGLGGAYMKGMTHAIAELKASVIFEFDADFQHDPELIPNFLKKIENGADLVLGSRYMKGGSIPRYWGLMRKILSVGGNFYIRTLMFDRKIHDWTTGYRALRPWVFEKVKSKITELKTYTFQISFLYYAREVGAKIAEVPLNFAERRWGESKMPGLESMIKTFWFVTRTRILDFIHSRFFKFGIVGFTGFLVNFGFLRLFRSLGLAETLSWLFSTEMAIINNYVFNNLWTFSEKKIGGVKNTLVKFLQFNLTSAGALAIQSFFGPLGVKLLGIKYDAAVLAFVVIFMVLPYNYIMYNLVIWRTWGKHKVKSPTE